MKLSIKQFVTAFLIMLLMIAPVLAAGTTRYPNPSGVDYDWLNEGRGTFAAVGTDFDTFGKSLTAPGDHVQIIDDFDNDSISEMLIIADDQAIIYQNKELDIIDGVDIGSAPGQLSNLLSFDIDNDGKKEIIFSDTTNDKVQILNYSAADGLQIQNSFTHATLAAGTFQQPMIACAAANECIITLDSSNFEDIFNPFTGYYRMMTFDSTGFTSSSAQNIYTESQSSSDAIALCSPRTKNIIVKDYDADGDLEYGISFMTSQDSSTPVVRYYVTWLQNNSVEMRAYDDETVADSTVDCAGESSGANLFTSPVAADINSNWNNMETYIGVQTSTDDFRIYVFNGNTTSKRESYPETLEADGVIISNIVIGNFFPETGVEDVCVLGYTGGNEIDLLCGTQDRFPNFDSDEFAFDTSNTFNLSTDWENQDVVIHAVQHSNAETDSNDLNEILSAYGIFELDYAAANTLERLWENPAGASTVISADIEQFGADDIIAKTSTNIFYYDDRLSNEPGELDDIEFNPCIFDSIIKVNETLQMIISASDTNDAALGFDDLNFDVFMYAQSTNEMNETFRNISTSQVDGSTSIISSFILNKTGSVNIAINIWDSENPTEIDEYTQQFSVQNIGIEFGDVTCNIEVEEVIVVVGGACTTDSDCVSGASCIGAVCVAQETTLPQLGMDEATEVFNMSSTILMLFVMFAFAIAVWFYPMEKNSPLNNLNVRFGAIIIFETLLLIIGTIFGWLHVAILITIIILSLIAGSVWITKKFTGAPQ